MFTAQVLLQILLAGPTEEPTSSRCDCWHENAGVVCLEQYYTVRFLAQSDVFAPDVQQFGIADWSRMEDNDLRRAEQRLALLAREFPSTVALVYFRDISPELQARRNRRIQQWLLSLGFASKRVRFLTPSTNQGNQDLFQVVLQGDVNVAPTATSRHLADFGYRRSRGRCVPVDGGPLGPQYRVFSCHDLDGGFAICSVSTRDGGSDLRNPPASISAPR